MFTSVFHLCLPLWNLKLLDLNFAWVPIWPFIFPSNLYFIPVCNLHFWHHVWKNTLCCHPGTSSCSKLVPCLSLLKRTREGTLSWIGTVMWLPVLSLSLSWYPDMFFPLKYNPQNFSCFVVKLIMFSVVLKVFNRGFFSFFFPLPHYGYSCIWLITFGS